MNTVTASDGAELAVRHIYGEEPTLVFIHGWANNQTVWEPELSQLSNEAYTMDLRGHGRSTHGEEEISIPILVKDLQGIIRRYRVTDYIFVGHSLGGMVALHHEVKHRNAKHLILLDTTAKPIGNQLTKYLARAISLPDVFHRVDEDNSIKQYVSSNILTFLQGLPSTSTNTILECYQAMHENSIDQTIRTPATVVRGDRDYLLPSRHTKSLQGVLEDVEATRIEDAGHFPQLERPDEVIHILREVIHHHQEGGRAESASSNRKSNG